MLHFLCYGHYNNLKPQKWPSASLTVIGLRFEFVHDIARITNNFEITLAIVPFDSLYMISY